MSTKALPLELLHKIGAYWRAPNHISVGQFYVYDNPLLRWLLIPLNPFTKGKVAILTRSDR